MLSKLKRILNKKDNHFMKVVLVFSLTLVVLFSCKKSNDIGYPPLLADSLVFKNLDQAWAEKDSNEINRWILSLSDSNQCDVVFYHRLASLSMITGFCYGNRDLTEQNYWTTSLLQRIILRKNISKVYIEYSKSKCFMSNVFSDELEIEIQEKYWEENKEIHDKLLKKIRFTLDSIYDAKNMKVDSAEFNFH